MVRFLHTSDWQIGMTRHFLDGGAQARFDQARIDAIRTLSRVARERACEFIVVAGDVFETNFVDNTTVARTLDALSSVGLPVLLLPGNHDFAGPGSVWDRAVLPHCPTNVTILGETGATPVPGVEVLGAPWRSKRPTTDLVATTLAGLGPPDGVRILVAHGAVERFAVGRTDPSIIAESPMAAAFAGGLLHYVALGDRHSTYEVLPRCWYSGAPEPTAFDEIDPGNVLIVELGVEGSPCTVERVPIATWRFHQVEHELRDDPSIDAALGSLDSIADRSQTIVRVVCSGVLPFAEATRFRTGLEARASLFAALDLRDTILARPTPADLAALNVGGYLRDAVASLMGDIESAGESATDAEEALVLLYRLAGDAR